MGYLEMFDEEFIDSLDKWIQDNDADVTNIKSVSYTTVKKMLETDYEND